MTDVEKPIKPAEGTATGETLMGTMIAIKRLVLLLDRRGIINRMDYVAEITEAINAYPQSAHELGRFDILRGIIKSIEREEV